MTEEWKCKWHSYIYDFFFFWLGAKGIPWTTPEHMSSSKNKVAHVPRGNLFQRQLTMRSLCQIKRDPRQSSRPVLHASLFSLLWYHECDMVQMNSMNCVGTSFLSSYQVKRLWLSIQTLSGKCLNKWMTAQLEMVAKTFNPSTREAKTSGFLWFETNLVYIESFRSVKAMYWEPVSKNFSIKFHLSLK